jgi:hypothetical protein
VYADGSNSVSKDADITAQTMDITIKDKSRSHSYHGTGSDEASWGRAVLDVSGTYVATMSGRLNSLNRMSAIVNQVGEMLNNYNATKYSIDTANANSSAKQKFETLFSKGSFEKGMVWMGADGCSEEALEEGIWQTEGGVNKAQHEMARIK